MDMSINSLKNNLTNLARDYLWEVLFASPKGGDTETLLLRCRSTSIPGRSVGSIAVPFKQNAPIQYPGKLTYSHSWSATFVEGEDREMWDAFYDWAQSIIDDETGIGSVNVKTDIYLNLLNTDGTSPMKIKIVGCFIKNQEDIAVSYDNEGGIMIPIVWSYDFWTKA